MHKIKKTGVSIKAMDDSGHGLARIAKMNEIDHDGDTYEKGAFSHSGDQWAQIMPAHNLSSVPLGKARVYEDGDEALAELHFNLKTSAGRDWFEAIKFDTQALGEMSEGNPIQEYSYGYHVQDAVKRHQDGKDIRVLTKLDVFEVSPVVRGAGISTRTLSIKEASLKAEHFDRLTGDLQEIAKLVAAEPDFLSEVGRKQLEALHEGLGHLLFAKDEDVRITEEAMAEHAFKVVQKHLETRS